MSPLKKYLLISAISLPFFSCVAPAPQSGRGPSSKGSHDSPVSPIERRRNASSADLDDYDRLDGTGASGKKVDVVEWEGNLEIHVYPSGSLAGLALKVDRRDKHKPVMVIGYRFTDNPGAQLIRRAILGIDLKDDFRSYREPKADGYDKIVVTNSRPWDGLVAYRLDPEPTQLYPDGHPALAEAEAGDSKDRTPAQAQTGGPDSPGADDSGTIRPFFMKEDRVGRGSR